MPIFSTKQIAELNEAANGIEERAQALVVAYQRRTYTSPQAEEYAVHGFCRRVSMLRHCIGVIYAALPPEFAGLPDKFLRETATVHIQAVVFNTFGALDNLALTWVHERNVLKANGRPLPNGRIGLTADKTEVRQSFPVEFQERLRECDEWFENLEAFRHSLGHRIPLYIPPFTIPPEQADQYRSLGRQATEALGRYDFDEHDRLKAAQDALCTFRPWMQHSLYGDRPPVVFHSQILADFATVELLGQQMLIALDTPVRAVRAGKAVP